MRTHITLCSNNSTNSRTQATMRQENEDQDDQQRSDDEYGLPRSRPLQAEKAIASTLVNMVSIFADFLTVSIHTILYEREIYSHDLFISTRAYNHPVRQARHPVLCKWIQDAVEACSVQLTEVCAPSPKRTIIHLLTVSIKGRVSKISLVAMSAHTFEPLERYVWDVSSFPVVPTGEHHTPFQSHTDLTALSGATLSDMEEQLRAAIGKIRTVSAGLAKLPDGCTFTISIELREEAPAPVGVGPTPIYVVVNDQLMLL